MAAKTSRCLVSTLSLVLCIALPANAQETTQKLAYEVYAGGIHAVQATIDITTENGRYDFVVDAQTRGFLGKLVPWEGVFESHGWITKDKDGKDKFQTELHKSTTGWREEIGINEYNYNKDGTFQSLYITDEHSERELRETTAELTDHTTDALTATMQILNDYNLAQQCEGSSEVFDGKRRFKQHFQHQEETTLTASKYSIFDGIAAECIVEVTPISGAWHKKPRGWLSIQEQGRERGTMPTVWIGKISEDGPAVPIKVRIKTGYGTLFMHLAEYESGDQKFIAKKRMKPLEKEAELSPEK